VSLPDSRGNAVVRLADELGLSRSQIIDEALALFLKAALEWAQRSEKTVLPTAALEK
jgi:hypothetical protein